MFQSILMYMPEEAYVLLIVISGLLIMVGLRSLGIKLLGGVVLLALLGPFLDALAAELPPWLLCGIALLGFLSLLRSILGGRVFDYLLGRILYNLLMCPFWFIRWLVGGFRPGSRT